MSDESIQEAYEDGVKRSIHAKPMDDVSKGMSEFFGGGWFKSESDKAYDKGWLYGSKIRNDPDEVGKFFDSILNSDSGKYSESSDSDSDSSYSSSTYQSVGSGLGFFITLIFIGIIVYSIANPTPETKQEVAPKNIDISTNNPGELSDNLTPTQKQGDEGFYYTEAFDLKKDRYYKLSWNNPEAMPFNIVSYGVLFRTYNYIIEKKVESTFRPYIAIKIEYPWIIRIDKSIQLRIGFSEYTKYLMEDVTGKVTNAQINFGGDLKNSFRNVR